MAWNFNGTTGRISYAGGAVSGLPCTLAAWAKPTATTGDNRILSLTDTVDNDPIISLIKYANGLLTLDWRDNAANLTSKAGTSTFSTSAWTHCAGTFDLTAGLEVFFNGVSEGTSGVTTGNPTLNLTTIGYLDLPISGDIQFWNGDIAECAIWNVVLPAAQIASLAKGASPLLIRPRSLVFYSALVRSANDIKGRAATPAGTTSVVPHPRIFQPPRAMIGTLASGEPPAGSDGTDMPRHHFAARPRYVNTRAEIARRETGTFFVDAPNPPILTGYVHGARPIRRPVQAPLQTRLWMPERLPDADPEALSDLPRYHFVARPRYPNTGAEIARRESGPIFIDLPSTPLLDAYVHGARPIRRPVQAPPRTWIWLPDRLPDAPPVALSDLPQYWLGVRPRYHDPAVLAALRTQGWRLVDATVPTPPVSQGDATLPPLIVTKRWRRRMMSRNPLFWSS